MITVLQLRSSLTFMVRITLKWRIQYSNIKALALSCLTLTLLQCYSTFAKFKSRLKINADAVAEKHRADFLLRHLSLSALSWFPALNTVRCYFCGFSLYISFLKLHFLLLPIYFANFQNQDRIPWHVQPSKTVL